MELKRYTIEELQELLPKIFYDYMAEDGVEKTKEQIEEKINNYRATQIMYIKALNSDEYDSETWKEAKEQLEYIEQGLKYLVNSNMQYQKELYKQTHSTDFCRTTVQIPLNKKINSFYDDLTLEVLFYDDVCTFNGRYHEYEKLESEEDKMEFLMRNTEITNIGLVYMRNGARQAVIEVIGKLKYNGERISKTNIKLLGQGFADFENLRLEDTRIIHNNDLRQWLQSKIDLDKENMEQLAKVFIRGDYYSIHQPQNNKNLYIRYVCRSTGRVYYNILDLNNLRLSSYFKENDYESYAKAWWNLTHLGSKVEGKPIIAC